MFFVGPNQPVVALNVEYSSVSACWLTASSCGIVSEDGATAASDADVTTAAAAAVATRADAREVRRDIAEGSPFRRHPSKRRRRRRWSGCSVESRSTRNAMESDAEAASSANVARTSSPTPADGADDALNRVRDLAAALTRRVDATLADTEAALALQEAELTRGFRAQLAGVLAELAAERAAAAAARAPASGGAAPGSAADIATLRARVDDAHVTILALRERVRELEAENGELRLASEMWAQERRALIRATADARRAADELERAGPARVPVRV